MKPNCLKSRLLSILEAFTTDQSFLNARQREALAELAHIAEALDEKKRLPFRVPTLEEVRLHAAKIGLHPAEADKFWYHHDTRGWLIGKVPMASWTSAMMTWKLKAQEFYSAPPPSNGYNRNGRPAGVSPDSILERETARAQEQLRRL